MNMKKVTVPTSLLLVLSGCVGDAPSSADGGSESETSATSSSSTLDESGGDGDPDGGDGDGTTTGGGDGDGDGDGDGACPTGMEGCECTDGGGCDPGLVCTSGSCGPPTCGDEVMEGTEQCDDGNLTNSDGCEVDCTRSVVVGLSAGVAFTCALFGAGDVRCWGSNEFGQLGHGLGSTSEFYIGDNESAVAAKVVDLGAPATKITAGNEHACALLETGQAMCWGKGEHGRLGIGTLDNVGDDETPVEAGPVDLNMGIVEMEAGGTHTCALREDGRVSCWGYNEYGQLGLNHNISIASPETAGEIEFPDQVVRLSLGNVHTCALFVDGIARCWGYNSNGELGQGHTMPVGGANAAAVPSLEPIDLDELSVLMIEAGDHHTCVILESKNVACWGYGGEGALGYGNDGSVYQFTGAVNLGAGGSALKIVAGRHTCSLSVTGEVKCWGYNAHGALGYGHTNNRNVPDPLVSIELDGTAEDIAAGLHHTCALMSSGDVRCWGRNDYGQLGFGHTSPIGDSELPFSAGVVPLF